MDAFFSFVISLATMLAGLFSLPHETVVLAQPLAHKSPEAVVLFGGDMMFDRSIRLAAEREGDDFILACLDPILADADLVVANLEGPITSEASVSASSVIESPENYTFTFPLSTADLLARHHIRMVNIGNNHIENFKIEGVRSTMQALDEAGVAHFGDTIEQRVANTGVNGVHLAFINFNQFAQSSTKEKTIEQIRIAKAAGRVVVVYTHWGDEYLPATDYEKELAHTFVDAGADIIIGSHPHVIQEHEVYASKHIYYSLGNLIFDQYWEDSVRHGLMLAVRLNKRGVVDVHEIPVTLERNRQTCPSA